MPMPWGPGHESQQVSWWLIFAMSVMAIGVWEALRAILLSATGHTQKKLRQELKQDFEKIDARLDRVEQIVSSFMKNPNLVYLDRNED